MTSTQEDTTSNYDHDGTLELSPYHYVHDLLVSRMREAQGPATPFSHSTFSFTNKTLKMGVKTNNKWTSLGAMFVTTHWTAGLLAAPLALYRANMTWSACWKQRRKWLFIAGKQACYSYLGSCCIFFATSLKPSEGKGQSQYLDLLKTFQEKVLKALL